MPSPESPRAKQLREFAEKGEQQGFEDLWLKTIDEAPAEIESFVAGADALASQGNFDKAGLFLSMLTPELLNNGLYAEALLALRKMAEVAPRERGLRHGLLTAFRALYAEDSRLEKLLEMSGLAEGKDLKEAVKKMDIFLGFKEGGYVFHPAGWGPGKVAEVDADEASIVIDFAEKKGHRISMEMAAKVTETVEANDLRAMKLDRADELQRLAEEEPVELIRCALRSRRGKAALRDLRERLAGDVIEAKSWSRWWQKARQQVKAAGDITITPGSNPTLELGEEAGGYADACLRDLRLLPNASRQVRYFRDLMKEAAAHEDGEDALAVVAGRLLGPAGDAAELGVGPAISLGMLLKDAVQRYPSLTCPPSVSFETLIPTPDDLVRALSSIPITGHRVASLIAIKKRGGFDWPDFCAKVLTGGDADGCDHCLAELIREGHTDVASKCVNEILDRYRELPESFLWYLRTARAGRLPKDIRREGHPTLLEKALVLHSHLDVASMRDNAESKKKLAKSLAAIFPLRDFAFAQEAFEHSTEAEAVNLASLLKNNRSLNRDIRDKMMAVMFRTRPEAGKALQGPEEDVITNPLFDPSIIFCTERALHQKRVEYEDVVNNQIPENSTEIGRAASYGDLSENAEWAAAIEKQQRLSQLAEELREGLSKARIIDGTEEQSNTVALGSRVTVSGTDGTRSTFTVLGPWEVDNERGFISYLSPLGKSLIGAAVGDEVTVEVPAGTLHYKIVDLATGLEAAEQAGTSAP